MTTMSSRRWIAGHLKCTLYSTGNGGLTDRLATQADVRSLLAQGPINNVVLVTTTLDAVLTAAPRKIDRIGYLNIDCEGRDLEVLKGFDLAKYSPDVITIEAFPDQADQTVEYLTRAGYERKEQLHLTLLHPASRLELHK